MKALLHLSELRPAGLRPAPRRRAYLRRYAWTAIVLGVILFYVTILQTRSVPTEGPGRVLYMFHDSVLLPMYGHVWLKYAPFSLMWVLPVATLILLALMEWLGLWGAIRALQIRATRWLIFWRPGRLALLVSSYLPWTRQAALARLVLDSEMDTLATQIRAGADKPNVFRDLAMLGILRGRLERKLNDPLRDIGQIALIRWAHPDPKTAERVSRKWAAKTARKLTEKVEGAPEGPMISAACDAWLQAWPQRDGTDHTAVLLHFAARLKQAGTPALSEIHGAVLLAVLHSGSAAARAVSIALSQRLARRATDKKDTDALLMQTDTGFWLGEIEGQGAPQTGAEADLAPAPVPRDIGGVFAQTGARVG